MIVKMRYSSHMRLANVQRDRAKCSFWERSLFISWGTTPPPPPQKKKKNADK